MQRVTRSMVSATVLAASLSFAPNALAEDPSNRLTEIARSALEAQNDLVVRGDVQAALRDSRHASAFRDAMRVKLERAHGKRLHLARNNVAFRAARTQLVSGAARVSGDTAILEASEVTQFDYASDSVQAGQRLSHRFIFVRSGGDWRMVSDSILDIEARFETRGERVAGTDSTTRRGTGPAGRAVPRPERARRNRGAGPGGGAALAPFLHLMTAASTRPAASFYTRGIVSTDDISAYAYSYAYNYNTAYREFKSSGGNDCANFVSQALKVGGWTETAGTQARTSIYEWWYGAFTQTYTWTSARDLYNFAKQSSPYRTGAAQYWSETLRGDIVFFDWTGDGSIDHSAVITGYLSNGEPLFSYHTTDRQNYALSSIEYDNANVVVYTRMVYAMY